MQLSSDFPTVYFGYVIIEIQRRISKRNQPLTNYQFIKTQSVESFHDIIKSPIHKEQKHVSELSGPGNDDVASQF